MFYELAYWLGPKNGPANHVESVPVAQGVLLSLLDDGLVEIAEVHWAAGKYDVVEDARARSIVLDPHSWRTGQESAESGIPAMFAYATTEAGHQVYFGSGGAV